MTTAITKKFKRWFRRFFGQGGGEIYPDEIFLDSRNLPEFNTHQFEGRLEKPLPPSAFYILGLIFSVVVIVFGVKLWHLEVVNGAVYAKRSEANRLDKTILFSDRGVIFDRNDVPLAWNEVNPTEKDFSLRAYSELSGLSSVLGFVKYPSKDTSGFYYQEDFEGKDGVELAYNDRLRGVQGIKLVEVNAHNEVQTESVLNAPRAGENLVLSIDSRIQHELYTLMADLSAEKGFTGGAAVITDVRTGEVVAKVSYPEYSSDVMARGKDSTTIEAYLQDKNNPFLDRTVDGLYTPGSIVKPYMALAALAENIIDPGKQILSTGSISIPNPYNPGQSTVFKDWRAHGWVDMRAAIAMSSDVYFYAVGGGYQDQRGLGISKIDKYMDMFGFSHPVESPFFKGAGGTIPTPEWKAEHFEGEAWTLGNTYHTSIGQYGFQVSPIQAVRAVGAIANDGTIHEPTIISDTVGTTTKIELDKRYYQIVKEGMRQGVVAGSAGALNVPYVSVATKTGTAELGVAKDKVNSWATGFFPYEDPHYAFAVIMERGPVENTTGAVYIMRQLLDWMSVNASEYFKK